MEAGVIILRSMGFFTCDISEPSLSTVTDFPTFDTRCADKIGRETQER